MNSSPVSIDKTPVIKIRMGGYLPRTLYRSFIDTRLNVTKLKLIRLSRLEVILLSYTL